MARVWLTICTAAALCSPAVGQSTGGKGQPQLGRNITISGSVQERATNAAVAHVRVVLESVHFGTTREASTDSRGHFEFSGIGHGIYFVRVKGEYAGANEATRSCNPAACRRVDLTVGSNEVVNLLVERLLSGAPNVPPEGPSATLDAQDAAVPERAKSEYEQGVKALEGGNVEGGLSHLRKAVAVYPPYTSAHFRLGAAYADLHRWNDAVQELRQATALNPKLAGAQLALGSVYLETNDFSDAEAPLRQAVVLDPNTPFGHFGLARVELARNNLDAAETEARKSLQLKSDFAAPYVLLGNVYVRRKDVAGARKAYEEYLRLEPSGPMASGTRNALARLDRTPQR